MVANELLLHNWFYGNLFVRELAAVVFAVLMGSIPVTPVMQWLFGDMEDRIARSAAALAPAVNTVKALIPVAIATHGGGLEIGLLAALAVVGGHTYCPWRHFVGGTGTAVAFGALSGVSPAAGIIFFCVWVAAAVGTNFAMVATLLASAVSIVSLWFFAGAPAALAGVAMLVIVASRYRGSFVRLSEGREPTLRSAPSPAARPLPAPRRTLVVVNGQTVQRV
jgi:glycerol-3-phosphate acyltransferase PlsY